VELEPRAEGSFTITPIALGNESSPRLRLTVLPATHANAGSVRELFIEVEADAARAYVQQQVIFSVRLFVGANLIEGSLSDPTPADTVIKRLGDDIQYSTQRGEKSYRVIERNYALFPQKSGSLEIPPVRFQGLTREPAQSNDRYFNRLFNNGKRARAKSKSLVLEIVPPASRFTGNHWLPAKRLKIDDLSRDQVEFRVGQPITRKLQIQALGLTAEQLPEINFTATSQFNVYPDKAVLETHQDKQNLTGLLQQSIALVPTETGEITLPELAVRWWNTQTDQPETAVLPAKTITVLAATSSDTRQKSPPTQLVETTVKNDSSIESQSVSPNLNSYQGNLWQWITLALTLAWLITLFLLWRVKTTVKEKQETPTSSSRSQDKKNLLKKVRTAIDQNDPRATRLALLAWSRALWQENPPGTISDLVERVNSPELQQALHQLDQHLYADPVVDWSGPEFWNIISRQFKAPAVNTESNAGPLPPLYPQSG
jgi:hypothetical protein